MIQDSTVRESILQDSAGLFLTNDCLAKEVSDGKNFGGALSVMPLESELGRPKRVFWWCFDCSCYHSWFEDVQITIVCIHQNGNLESVLQRSQGHVIFA